MRVAARVTTTFDNGRTHVVTVWLGQASLIEVDEDFNVGPDDKYKFKEYKDDRDELCLGMVELVRGQGRHAGGPPE